MLGGCREKKDVTATPMHAPNCCLPTSTVHLFIAQPTSTSKAYKLSRLKSSFDAVDPCYVTVVFSCARSQSTVYTVLVLRSPPPFLHLVQAIPDASLPASSEPFFFSHTPMYPCSLFRVRTLRTAGEEGPSTHHMPGGCNGVCQPHSESFPDLHIPELAGLAGVPNLFSDCVYCMFATRFTGFSSRSSSMRLWFLRRLGPSRCNRIHCLGQRVFRACRAD
jgi:hypothetical protein